jgi:hypothetical protein
VHIAAPQPAHLPTPQPGPRHQQHDQPVPRRPAGPQQRNDLLIAGPIDRRFRFPQPMPGPHPPRHPTVLAAGLHRQVPVVGDLIQHRHQPRRTATGHHRVHHHAPHRGQHPVDPRRTPHRSSAGTGHHHARSVIDRCPGVGQPRHEQRELLDTGLPGPARPGAPAQEQRDRMRICLRRGLGRVAAEPQMPQILVGDTNHLQVLVQHRPIPLPGR